VTLRVPDLPEIVKIENEFKEALRKKYNLKSSNQSDNNNNSIFTSRYELSTIREKNSSKLLGADKYVKSKFDNHKDKFILKGGLTRAGEEFLELDDSFILEKENDHVKTLKFK
jgi:hypothetical protein